MTNLHITDLEWSKFWQNQLSPSETDRLLEHACSCELCSARMADGIPEEQLLTAPGYLKRETLTHCSPKVKRYSPPGHRFQLYTYSLKVGLAVAAALLLLIRVELPEIPPAESDASFSLTAFLNDGSSHIAQKLNDFSSNLLYKEDLP